MPSTDPAATPPRPEPTPACGRQAGRYDARIEVYRRRVTDRLLSAVVGIVERRTCPDGVYE